VTTSTEVCNLSCGTGPGQLQTGNGCQMEFTLKILGRQIPFSVHLVREQATLSDLVPLARELCNKVTSTVVASLRRNGEQLACRKGCSACCYYLVPVSVPEAFRLYQEIMALPQPQRARFLQRSLQAARRILSMSVPSGLVAEPSCDSHELLERVSRWYTSLALPCPFLTDGLCGIYPIRPIACREHIAAGSNCSCRSSLRQGHEPTVVEMPVSAAQVLGELCVRLEPTAPKALILPLALAWASDNIEQSQRTWPSQFLVKCFVEQLESALVRCSADLIPQSA